MGLIILNDSISVRTVLSLLREHHGVGGGDCHHIRSRGGGGGVGGDNDCPMTSLTTGASLYVATMGEALRNRLDLSTPLCHKGGGEAACRLLLAFSGWAYNPEDIADLLLLCSRGWGSGDTVGSRVNGGSCTVDAWRIRGST